MRSELAAMLRRQADRLEKRFAQSFPGTFFDAVHNLDCAFAGLFRALADALDGPQQEPGER